MQSQYKILLEALKLMASPYEKQITYFPNYVEIPDEIALIFSDAFLLSHQLKKENIISIKIFELLKELDNMLDAMSDNEKIWDLEELKNNTIWGKCRISAKKILDEMNEPFTEPDLSFITWTQ